MRFLFFEFKTSIIMFKDFSHGFGGARNISRRRLGDHKKLSFRPLEARRLLAAITVNSSADTNIADGQLTLRESVLLVNGAGDASAALGRALSTEEAAQIDLMEDFGTGDTITLVPALSGGTITLSGTELELAEPVTLDGTALATPLTIDAGGQSRIFNITAPEGDFALKGLALQNGFTTESGGAVRIANGDLTVEDSVISGSSATEFWGGGIYAEANADVSLVQSTVTGNSANWGGGILGYGSIKIADSVISDNTATVGGGGLYGNNSITVSDSTISGNSATYGGAVYTRGATTITNSTISGNSAVEYGGGIFSDASTTITNSTLSGNSANYGGGILSTGSLTVTNSTVLENSAAYSGGGIYNYEGTATVNNSIVANSFSGGDVTGTIFDGTHNLIGDGSFLNSFTNSILGDPMLGPLADNGGVTRTHAVLATSPVIDAGENAVAVDAEGNPLQFDQLNEGFDRVFGAAVDIGAVEFTTPAFVLGDVNGDGVVDFSDIPSFIAVLQEGNFLDAADINGDGVVDFSDISFFIDLLINQ